ncbi:MAG: Nif3-like dinuclear metal center hexameric protein [Deltaproteobacteria bacterium]|jgi:dinuclear metal center YbgI/SA1388 family protein|nr:Nif3-like dinuclear metal center hexameric protein [Deltaproteobacteria bacterium]
MNPGDVIAVIENMAPPAAAAAWDVSGVQVASRRDRITRLAVMLDPAPRALAAAAADGAEFILAHHPLSLHPRFPNSVDAYTDILALLLGEGIWLYSAHTSLDGNPDGPVRWLAEDLALTDVRLLEPAAQGGYGFGFVGLLPGPLTYEDFCARLGEIPGLSRWAACGARPPVVRLVACCPGSGSELIPLARSMGADVFISGDLKYHPALEASEQLPRVLDVGHFCLEEEMMSRFAARLQEALPLPVTFYPGRNPFIYS